MKVMLLLAHCMSNELKVAKDSILKVLEELDIEVDTYDLSTLPYYREDEKSPVAMLLGERIQACKGIIILTKVHILGVHSTVHSFFEHITHYQSAIYNKPLLAITSTAFKGERRAGFDLLEGWMMLGGVDGGMSTLNTFTPLEEALDQVEKQVEQFYRIMKQERTFVGCSEYYLYHQQSNNKEKDSNTEHKETIKHKEIIKHKETITQMDEEVQQEVVYEAENEQPQQINLSTKEQNIQDLAKLLRTQLGEEQDTFYPIEKAIQKDRQQPIASKGIGGAGLSIARLPHYFVAQHDKSIDLCICYKIIDSEQVGYIIVRDGDCVYKQESNEKPHIEIVVNEEQLKQLLMKKITYQKAFMIGKIKVKGNFAILSKIDQLFKDM